MSIDARDNYSTRDSLPEMAWWLFKEPGVWLAALALLCVLWGIWNLIG